jgi:hypothetical protein
MTIRTKFQRVGWKKEREPPVLSIAIIRPEYLRIEDSAGRTEGTDGTNARQGTEEAGEMNKK